MLKGPGPGHKNSHSASGASIRSSKVVRVRAVPGERI